jgi:hypothetical protein
MNTNNNGKIKMFLPFIIVSLGWCHSRTLILFERLQIGEFALGWQTTRKVCTCENFLCAKFSNVYLYKDKRGLTVVSALARQTPGWSTRQLCSIFCRVHLGPKMGHDRFPPCLVTVTILLPRRAIWCNGDAVRFVFRRYPIFIVKEYRLYCVFVFRRR